MKRGAGQSDHDTKECVCPSLRSAIVSKVADHWDRREGDRANIPYDSASFVSRF
jgi:hypothetical protein